MPFASPEQIAARMGRPLSTGEEAHVEAALAQIATAIAAACGRELATLEALVPAPSGLEVVSIQAAVRVLVSGEAKPDEPLLTPAEERTARRAVWGSNVASSLLGSIHDEAEFGASQWG